MRKQVFAVAIVAMASVACGVARGVTGPSAVVFAERAESVDGTARQTAAIPVRVVEEAPVAAQAPEAPVVVAEAPVPVPPPVVVAPPPVVVAAPAPAPDPNAPPAWWPCPTWNCERDFPAPPPPPCQNVGCVPTDVGLPCPGGVCRDGQ